MSGNILVIGPLPTIQLLGARLPTYHIFISLVLLILVGFIYKRCRREQISLDTALDLFLVSVVSGAIGARLFHIFYEEPWYYWRDPIKVLYFWEGGFVFYAGLLSGLLAGYITVRIKKESAALWLDFAAPVISLGYALGRIACFLEGCCYGKICDLPWAYGFQQLDYDTGNLTFVNRHPTQLYAVGLELILLVTLLYWEKTKHFARQPGHLFAYWLLAHSVGRIFIETLRDDDRGFWMGNLSISTFISFCLVLTLGFYFLTKRK